MKPYDNRTYGWQYPDLTFDEHGCCLTNLTIDNSNIPPAHRFYRHDMGLRGGLRYFLGEQLTFADFGCGDAWYAKYLNENTDLDAHGFDGNPYTHDLSSYFGIVQDLAVPFNLGKTFNCVMSLNVGEYIPIEFERIYLDNLIKHTNYILIIAWDDRPGLGVVNPRSIDWVKDYLAESGLTWNEDGEKYLRHCVSEVFRFKLTLTVFIK